MSPPNPGSPEALALGCACPQMDNHYGLGCRGTHDSPEKDKQFFISGLCRLHSKGTQAPIALRLAQDEAKLRGDDEAWDKLQAEMDHCE